MNSETILEKLIERYQRLRTYQNVGFVQHSSDEDVSRFGFRTYFERPGNYRFDWWSKYSHPANTKGDSIDGQIWSNPNGSFVRYGNQAHKKRRNLKTALSAGFPHSDAALLPMSLLLPDVVQFEHCIYLMKDGVLRPKPSFMPFYQIFFQRSPEESLELYIQEEDCSLIRIRKMTSFQFTEEVIELLEKAPDDDDTGIPKETRLADMKLLLNEVHQSVEDYVYEEQFFDQRIWGEPFTGLPIERK